MKLSSPIIGARPALLASTGVILITLSFLIYIYRPSELIATSITTFGPNSKLFELWKTPPLDILIKIYIFNVTNIESFLSGKEKMRFQEVGPYTYRESMYNINITFNDNGTLSFIPKRNIAFSINHSIGDPFVDRYVLPNAALLGITSYLHDSSMITNLAMSSLTSYLNSQPFVNLTVDEFLFGYDDPLVKMISSIVPNWIDFTRLGLLDRVMAIDNASDYVTINVKPEPDYSILTKEKDIMSYGIERWGNSPGLLNFGYVIDEEGEHNSKCNSLEGALMGTLYPKNMDTNKTLRIFRAAFCRTIPFIFHGTGVSKNMLDINTFKVDPMFLARKENNSENSCYCQKEDPSSCLPNGLGDISACYYGIPIAISNAHMLYGDPSILENFDGLLPDKNKHESSIGIHSKSGIPIEANIKIQINLIIPETKYNSKTRPFNNLVIPLLWAEITMDELPSEILLYIRILYYILPLTEEILMYVLGILGVVFFSLSSLLALLALKKHNLNYYSTLPLKI